MAFPVDDILLGPASFGLLHRLDGIIWHTGEEAGFTRHYAVATRNYQLTHPGSYNFRLYDGGAMLNVPYLEASGGVNPSSSAWAPERYAFLKQRLDGPCHIPSCGGAYRNPTMHHLQVSFVGRTADLDAGKAPASFVPDAKRLIEWIDALPNRGPRPLVHSKHAHWQTNRSDPGSWIWGQLFGLPDTATGGDMPIITRPVREKWRIPAGCQFWTGGPELGDEKRFTIPVELWSNGETTDNLWRRCEYGDEELWFRRHDITPIPGTRNPASGFGAPTLTTVVQGISKESYGALQAQAAAALDNIGVRAKADADAIRAKRP